MKKEMMRSGGVVLGLIVMALAAPLLMGALDPAVKPIVTDGTVLEQKGSSWVIHADDGLDIQLHFADDSEELLYVGEHGEFSYVPKAHVRFYDGNGAEKGWYSLLTVRDFEPGKRGREDSSVNFGARGMMVVTCGNSSMTIEGNNSTAK